MGHKVQIRLTADEALKAEVKKSLRRGDQVRIARILGCDASYVKKILKQRPNAKSPLAMKVWVVADRLRRAQEEIKAELV